MNRYGCSICGATGTNKSTCPLNPQCARPNPSKHNQTPKVTAPVTRSTPTPVTRSTPTPVTRSTPTPVTRSTPTPVTRSTPTPVTRSTPTPVTRSTPTPVKSNRASSFDFEELPPELQRHAIQMMDLPTVLNLRTAGVNEVTKKFIDDFLTKTYLSLSGLPRTKLSIDDIIKILDDDRKIKVREPSPERSAYMLKKSIPQLRAIYRDDPRELEDRDWVYESILQTGAPISYFPYLAYLVYAGININDYEGQIDADSAEILNDMLGVDFDDNGPVLDENTERLLDEIVQLLFAPQALRDRISGMDMPSTLSLEEMNEIWERRN